LINKGEIMEDLCAMHKAMARYEAAILIRNYAEYMDEPVPSIPRQDGVVVDAAEALGLIDVGEIGGGLSVALCFWEPDQELAVTAPMTPGVLRVLAIHLLHCADLAESGKEFSH
jgi:hypothetical protein